MSGVSPVCGEPTFQIRIVVPVCACGVTTSSAANAVHANVRNMRASVVQLDDRARWLVDSAAPKQVMSARPIRLAAKCVASRMQIGLVHLIG